MKKLILALVLVLFFASIASARMNCVMVGGAGTVTAGASCAYSSGQSCTVATDDSTTKIGGYIGQGNYYPSSNMNLCQIDLWVVTKPEGGNVTVYVFEMSGTSLGTEVCHTETKASSTLSDGAWNTFAITGDCNIVSGGTTKYGIVALIPVDYPIELGDKTVSGGCTTQGGLETWLTDKALSNSYASGYDALFKVYGK
jgi:hypothetical protein